MDKYNKIIENIYGSDFVPILEKITLENGFNSDNLHWNKNGHKVVSKILMEKIVPSLEEGV